MKTSKDPRHQTRRLALSIIYSTETFNREESTVDMNIIRKTAIKDLKVTNYDKTFLQNITNGVSEYNAQLKGIISENSNEWDIDKMYIIDISILLIATWEINYTDTPQKVIVDEAVELAKEFSGSESSKFVNGILSGVITTYEKSNK